MTKGLRSAAILCAVILLSTVHVRADEARLLVRMRRPLTEALSRDAGIRSVAPRLALTEWRVVTLHEGADPRRSAAILSSDPSVLAVERDRDALLTSRMPDDLRSDQWALDNTGQRVGAWPGIYDADIDAPEAWELSTGDRGILVAVLDSGVAADHPDLAGNLLAGIDFFTGGPAIDDSALGHGTAVAGIIGARGDNALGMTGVSWNAGLLPMKVCDGGGRCPYSAIIAALDAAARARARVVNLSMTCDEHLDPATRACGTPRPGACRSAALEDAIRAAGRAGMLVVTAAGNCGSDLDGEASAYPCAFDLPNLICVAASDGRDEIAPFSNRGRFTVDIAAPGTDIVSIGRDRETILSWDGTSFAAPLVAGAASLLLARNDELTPRALRARLMDGDALASLTGVVATGARLNARRAIEGLFLNAAFIGGTRNGARGLTGDFDGDGHADALEAGRWGVSVARGDGETLGAFSVWSGRRAPGNLSAGDVDGDGRDDLVLVTRRGIATALSQGNRFDDERPFSAAGVTGPVQLADVDGDGRVDAVEWRPGAGVLVHLSRGDRFAPPVPWSALGSGLAWTIADMDGDGRGDLVRVVAGEIGVSLSSGNGFDSERRWRAGHGPPLWRVTRVMGGDVDGDGLADLALRAPDGCWEVALAVDRDDVMAPARPWACGHEGGFQTLVDIDEDGRDDLVRLESGRGWSMLRSSR